MEILEALRETGMAGHLVSDTCYCRVEDGILKWFTKKDNRCEKAVSMVLVVDLDWQSYNPELEKCEACRIADNVDCSYELSQILIWLLKRNCTCTPLMTTYLSPIGTAKV